jgi:F-type H+-transporting ATPase subunit a
VVVAELLPNVNELFEWKGIFFKDSILEFNKTALMAMVSTVICLAIFFVGSRRKALVPTGLQNVTEFSYEMVEQNISVEVMGAHEGKKWTPFLATLFFWIFFINIWSTVPAIYFPATSRLAIPLYLALQTWAIMIIVGIKHQGLVGYFKGSIFPPGVPPLLYILVTPIELVSKFLVRPFSLAVRLFANMAAGHVLLAIFVIMTNELFWKHPSGWFQVAFSPLPFFALLAMTGFELLVAVLQAYIFTILTAVYVNESVHPEH